MPKYSVSFTAGDPLEVLAPSEDEAKAHAKLVTQITHDGKPIASRGLPVSVSKVKD